MQNPWTAIVHNSEESSSAKDRWIHRLDRPFIADKTVASDLLPEPFIGNPAAPIYLLALNPGYHTDNDQEHQRPEFRKILLQNLLHDVHDWPFYYLNPQFSSTRRGKWWREKFTNLMDEVDDDQTVSRSFFCMQLFPYHSEDGKPVVPVPSILYTRHLLLQAISTRKTIVFMRSKKLWFWLVPELLSCTETFTITNPRNPVISKNGFQEEGAYRRLLSILTKGSASYQ